MSKQTRIGMIVAGNPDVLAESRSNVRLAVGANLNPFSSARVGKSDAGGSSNPNPPGSYRQATHIPRQGGDGSSDSRDTYPDAVHRSHRRGD
jgi:hypothetical protein